MGRKFVAGVHVTLLELGNERLQLRATSPSATRAVQATARLLKIDHLGLGSYKCPSAGKIGQIGCTRVVSLCGL